MDALARNLPAKIEAAQAELATAQVSGSVGDGGYHNAVGVLGMSKNQLWAACGRDSAVFRPMNMFNPTPSNYKTTNVWMRFGVTTAP